MADYASERETLIQNAMRGAYDPARQYNDWRTLARHDRDAQLGDLGVNEIGQATGTGQLGQLQRHYNLGIERLGQDQYHQNIMDRGSFASRGIGRSGLMTARNREVAKGYNRQRDDLSLGFSEQSTDILKRARDLVSRFNIEEGQKKEDWRVKTPLHQLGVYSFGG